MVRPRLIRVLILLATAGCASAPFGPGHDVNPGWANRWECQLSDVERLTQEAVAGTPKGQVLIPQVGWDACHLMAALGVPQRTDLQQTTSGRYTTWWYEGYGQAHMVTLENRGALWVVNYVGW